VVAVGWLERAVGLVEEALAEQAERVAVLSEEKVEAAEEVLAVVCLALDWAEVREEERKEGTAEAAKAGAAFAVDSA